MSPGDPGQGGRSVGRSLRLVERRHRGIHHFTEKKEQFINITSLAQKAVDESGVRDGIVVVFVPHTTARITINENADPDVVHDMCSVMKIREKIKKIKAKPGVQPV